MKERVIPGVESQKLIQLWPPDVQEWREIVPLDRGQIPDFPGDLLPGWLGAFVTAVALATETPIALASMLALAAVATCVAKKYEVSPEPGYTEPVNVWMAPAMESGNRKTAVLNAVTAPIAEWEADQIRQLTPQIDRLTSQRKTLQAQINRLRRLAGNPNANPSELHQEIERLEAELPVIPIAPKLWCDDVTPQKLGIIMAEQRERIAIISDEGGIFDHVAGRYGGGAPNLDLFLKAHAGSEIRVDRVDRYRPPVILRRPALTLGLSPQPEVLLGLAKKRELRGRGLLARVLFGLPVSRLGDRELVPRPVPVDVQSAYHHGIRALLELSSNTGPNGEQHPRILQFDVVAYAKWKAFQGGVENMMREGGQLEHLRDWGSKLPGQAARIAALLHVVKHSGGRPGDHTLDEPTTQAALTFATLLIPHALAVFDLLGADPLLEDARAVVRWIKRSGEAAFTARECFCAMQTRFRRMDALRPVLAVLVEHGYIRQKQGEKPPHRPSEEYIVNPAVLEETA